VPAQKCAKSAQKYDIIIWILLSKSIINTKNGANQKLRCKVRKIIPGLTLQQTGTTLLVCRSKPAKTFDIMKKIFTLALFRAFHHIYFAGMKNCLATAAFCASPTLGYIYAHIQIV
jgi:hypothetical protein